MKPGPKPSLLKKIQADLRIAYYYSNAAWQRMFCRGGRIALPSPKERACVGGGDFEKTGEDFLRLFIKLGNLKPHEKVADIGCGIGRMAIPLTKYLNRRGSYEGLDIAAKGIEWCGQNITSQYPNFRFQTADVFNQRYHPKGKQKASEYRFPYEDAAFDFICLASVFTHMLAEDMENYLSEISRVLNKNGRCLMTFFLLNSETLELMRKKESALDFKYPINAHSRSISQTETEAAIAYEEGYLRTLCGRAGLRIIEPIHYGSWRRKAQTLRYQDIISAVKITA